MGTLAASADLHFKLFKDFPGYGGEPPFLFPPIIEPGSDVVTVRLSVAVAGGSVMRRAVLGWALGIFASVAIIAPGWGAESRVALVIGNGAYRNAVQLPNAARDAEAIAATLKTIGFDVVLGTDLDRERMTQRLSDFASRADGADVALFFYAGHGIQLDGRNLLVPIDADLKTELDAKVRTVEVDTVLQNTIGDAKVKLVLLDACRDNPFAKQIQASAPKSRSVTVSTGLAEMRPGSGTLIAFATGPGQVALDGEGSHSPFTRALLDNLARPDVEIRHTLAYVRAQVVEQTKEKQLPWENTNLTGFFYMNKSPDSGTPAGPAAGPANTAAPSAPAVGALNGSAMEMELWTSVKTSNSADEYRAYLEKFPNGTFADLARTRIASLSRGTPASTTTSAASAAAEPAAPNADPRTADATAATEDALGLDLNAWRAVQQHLGVHKVDGKVSEQTRKSLKTWQSAHSFPVTGFLNKAQYDAMVREPMPNTANAKESPKSAQTTRSSGSGSHSNGQRAQGIDPAVPAFIGGMVGGALSRRLPF